MGNKKSNVASLVALKSDESLFNDLMTMLAAEFAKDAEAIVKELGINLSAAHDIAYLRTRARWTQEKETYLVGLAKRNLPLPDMMEDFEVKPLPEGIVLSFPTRTSNR
jgi:hypothetical protein